MSRSAGTTPSRLPQSPAVADDNENDVPTHNNNNNMNSVNSGQMLYNTTVRSMADSRPVMLRVPLRTPCRGVEEDSYTAAYGNTGDSHRNCNSNKHYNNNNNNNNNNMHSKNSAEKRSGNHTNVTLLTSPAPVPPALLPTEDGDKNHEIRQALNSPTLLRLTPTVKATAAARTTTTTLRRSSSALLVSPRPSPPRRRETQSVQRIGHSSKRRLVRMQLSQSSNSSSDIDSSCRNCNSGLVPSERIPVGEILSAVPPRRRVTTVRSLRLPPPTLSNEMLHKLPSSTLETPPLTSDIERLSPTSLHFSLPRDTGSKSLLLSSSSTSSNTTTSAARRQRSRGIQNMSTNSISSKCHVVYPLLRGNEGWTTSEGENSSSSSSTSENKERRKRIISGSPFLKLEERKRSAYSGKSLGNTSRRVASEPQCLPTSHTSLTQTTQSGSNNSNKSRRARSAVPSKSDLMRAFHELQLQKEVVVLMEYEEKGRRTIRDAYIKGMRRILLEHTFKPSMLFASGEKTRPQTTSSYSSYSYSSPQEKKTRSSGSMISTTTTTTTNNNNNNNNRVQTRLVGQVTLGEGINTRKDNTKSVRHSSTPHTSPKEKALRCTTNRSTRSSVEVNSEKNEIKENFMVSSTPIKEINSQEEKEEKKELPTRGQEGDSSVGSRGLRTITKYTSPVRDDVNESMDNIQRTMRLFEAQLLRLLSDEINQRKILIENEAAEFYFFLRYHRIVEVAMQPVPIYLQEACEWQSILTEATNELHRLQSERIEFELQQRLKIARDCAHRIAALISNETQIREKEIRQAELQERRELLRFFQLGIAALLEVQACYTRQRERQIANGINLIVLEEVREREMIQITELRSRGMLYRRIETEYQECTRNKRDVVEMTAVSCPEKKDVTVGGDIAIELSAITSNKDEQSYMTTDMEVQELPSHSEVINQNTTTFSYVHSGNSSGVHPVLVDKSVHDDGYSGLSYPGNDQNVERIFFEWNPTSNTIPTTNTTTTHSNNITMNTAGTGVVAGVNSLVFDSSSGEPVRPWTISSPPPRGIPHTTTTTDSTAKYNKGNNDTTGTTATTTLVTEILPQQSRKSKIKQFVNYIDSGSSKMPKSTSEVSKDMYNTVDPSVLSVEESFLVNDTRRDIGVTANLSSQSISESTNVFDARPTNCHLVPCSLKKKKTELSPCIERRCSDTPLPASNKIMPEEQSKLRVSCGTQLTPPTKRPYRDDVIFEGTPQRPQKHIEGNEALPLLPSSTSSTSSVVEAGVEDVLAEKAVVSEPSVTSVSSSCSSLSSVLQGDNYRHHQNPQEFDEIGEEGDRELFDSVEELEEPLNWSQSAVEIDEKCIDKKSRGNNMGEEVRCSVSRGSPIVNIVLTSGVGEGEQKTMRSERTVSRTSDMARRASETLPEVSLSTMLEATSAGSVDYHENERVWNEQKSAGVALHQHSPSLPLAATTNTTNNNNNNNNIDYTTQSDGSSCSSFDHNVSASTGVNVKTDDNRETYVDDYNKENISGYFGRVPNYEEIMASPEKCHCNCVSNYPPFNYMRPTMSWRRQHEELEWRALLHSSRGRSSKNGKSTSVNILQSPSRRRAQSNPSQHLKRIPFEEGPGVWGDVELKRRPFGFDRPGDKAYKASERLQPESSITTTICSPRYRQDTARRFMSEGSITRGNSRRSLSRHSSPIRSESPIEDPMMLASLRGIIEEREVSPRRVTKTAKTGSTGRGTGTGTIDATINVGPNEKFFGIRKRSKTPSYVDTFFKQDPEMVGRRCFLAALQHGPVLRDSSRNGTPVSTGMTAANTTPHRRHCLHHQRCSENTLGNATDMMLSPGTFRGSLSRSSWSPQPKPWR
ncbi:hypothetical protein LSM04_009265 [Trypanosoma melophagium]|uniref:uncharacterized protein n=2 Tax=Trypanosoma melophagium TaxID=715481 RepID=UPI00351A7D86|nr:hypothetical protein LSM04_009265 [Trypanosoma melophagium]